MSNMGFFPWQKGWAERVDALLERVKIAAFTALSRSPMLGTNNDVKAIAPGATVTVASVDVSALDTAFAFQVQFVSEDPTAHAADSERFATTVQGDPALPVATTPTIVIPQASTMVTPPTYTVVVVGTTLTATVKNNGLNPINTRARFYADIESF
jgi:hypothetical protein